MTDPANQNKEFLVLETTLSAGAFIAWLLGGVFAAIGAIAIGDVIVAFALGTIFGVAFVYNFKRVVKLKKDA